MLQIASRVALASLLLVVGDIDGARVRVEGAATLALGFVELGRNPVFTLLAEVEVAAGRIDAALVALQRAGDLDMAIPFSFGGRTLWIGAVQVPLAESRFEDARAIVEPILHLAVESGARSWEPDARHLLAAALAGLGRVDEAVVHLRKALEVADEIGRVIGRKALVADLAAAEDRLGAAAAS